MFNSKTPVTIEPPAPAMPVSGVPGGPGGYGESEVHLLDRLSVIYRYRNVVIAVIFIVLIGGAVQTYTTTKEYRTTATVQIDPERAAVPGLAAAGMLYNSDDEEYQMETELSRLRSHQLARKVATALGLENNGEFNGKESQPTGLGDAILNVRRRVMDPVMSLFRGNDAPSSTGKVVAPVVANDDGPPETPEEAKRVELLMSHTHVDRVLGTRLVKITVESRHREFAVEAANAFATVYRDQNLLAKTAALQNKAEQARKTAELKHNELEVAKNNYLNAQKLSPGGANIDASVLMTWTANSRQDWTRASIDTENKKSAYNVVAKVDLSGDPMVAMQAATAFSGDRSVGDFQQQILAKQKELRQAVDVEKLLPAHPKVIGLNNEIEVLKSQLKQRLQQIVDSARQDYENAKSSELRYKEAYELQDKTSNSQQSASIPLSFLKQEVDRLQTSLSDIEQQREGALVEMSAVSNNVRVMDRAQTPGSPFKPDPARNMLMALLGGFVVALALAFGLDYLDDTVKTPEDITRKLHVPFLGLVPSVRGDKQPVLSGPVPHDFGESYRALRTSLVFTSGGESTRVITVTSAQPLEGKTTTACNLAMVLAFGGSRVLLVDADMRRPGVHKALKISNTVGLSHLLVGQARVREAIQRTSDPNFCVMTAGRTPPNPSELLSSERMRQLVANLKQGPFDWVVIDTPPVLAVTDAIILTPLVDGVTFVVGAEMTRRRLAERAVHMIMASRPKVVGAVLNRVNFDRNKYYYSRYYGYQYKSYYGTSTSATSAPAKD
jgi:capsular exopolysaccharide synthesis family protein